jgi:two-component system, cell cycle sensor histidine kinase and response regulator CckA
MLYSAARTSHPSNPPVQRTVLLVEDEPFVREATRSILENAGLSVLAAENAVEAMRIYENCERPIDLVMTDMVLPGSTGQQLGQDLRKRSQQLSVLVTSGYTDAEYDIEDPATQTYFLAKPYSRGELLGKVGFILGKQEAQRAAMQAS